MHHHSATLRRVIACNLTPDPHPPHHAPRALPVIACDSTLHPLSTADGQLQCYVSDLTSLNTPASLADPSQHPCYASFSSLTLDWSCAKYLASATTLTQTCGAAAEVCTGLKFSQTKLGFETSKVLFHTGCALQAQCPGAPGGASPEYVAMGDFMALLVANYVTPNGTAFYKPGATLPAAGSPTPTPTATPAATQAPSSDVRVYSGCCYNSDCSAAAVARASVALVALLLVLTLL